MTSMIEMNHPHHLAGRTDLTKLNCLDDSIVITVQHTPIRAHGEHHILGLFILTHIVCRNVAEWLIRIVGREHDIIVEVIFRRP